MYLLQLILCSFFIVFILPNPTIGSYKDEYLMSDGESFELDGHDLKFMRLEKRESPDYKPDAKPVILKKGTTEKKPVVKSSAKDALKDNTTTTTSPLPGGDTTTESSKPIDTNTTKTTTPQPSNSTYEVPVTTDLPDLPDDLPKNYTEGNVTAHYIYYNSTFIQLIEPNTHWVDFSLLPKNKVKTHVMLSSSHRRAATVSLPFDFPFYGHKIRNITIATGGFLYTGDYMHTWLAATQYIAPLMANFDTSIHNESTIKYAENGDNFTVQWEKVYLQDKSQGPFTFQVTLHKSGDIEFVYKTVPITINLINDESHPVKVGLSDAYIMEKMVVFIRRKTIYEYHRADVSHFNIQNNTCIYFTALPTCQNFSTCEDCISSDIKFECSWCDTVSRCSTGLDRHRQDWINAKCDEEKPSDYKCKAPTPAPIPTKPSTDKKPLPVTTPSSATSTNVTSHPYSSTESTVTTYTTVTPSVPPKLVTLPPGKKGEAISIDPAAARIAGDEDSEEIHKHSVGAGSVIAILIIVCSVLGFALWVGYAYKYPQSPSGQLLIRYRPSQWRWRHGEARYTAASIHI